MSGKVDLIIAARFDATVDVVGARGMCVGVELAKRSGKDGTAKSVVCAVLPPFLFRRSLARFSIHVETKENGSIGNGVSGKFVLLLALKNKKFTMVTVE